MAVLKPASINERALQDHFNHWRKWSTHRVGAPRWLEKLNTWHAGFSALNAWNDRFKPDVLARDGTTTFVFELKHAGKYEPLAVAEVLHHARALRQIATHTSDPPWLRSTKFIKPVIVAQSRGWIRETFAYLREHGLKPDALRILEVTALRPSNRKSVWFWFHELNESSWRRTKYTTLPPRAQELLLQDTPTPDADTRFYRRLDTAVFARLDGSGQIDTSDFRGTQRWITETRTKGSWLSWTANNLELGKYSIS